MKRTTKRTREAVELHARLAMTAWLEQERAMKGDAFATEKEMEMLLAEPLAHLDMLPRDAKQFLTRMLEA